VDLFVTFIGTAASVPSASRGTSATLVARGGERWLIDCGEGTQRQLLRSGAGLVDLDLILLTHLHGDHYLGLPGLLKTYGLRGRDRTLRVGGPRGLVRLVDQLRTIFGRTPFPLELEEWDPGTVWTTDGGRVEAFPTDHSVPSLGYALIEDDRPGAFDLDAARAMGIPPGPLYGRLQRGEEITLDDGRAVRPGDVLGAARPGRRVVFSGDTRPCATTLAVARRADLLVHEATFVDDERDRAAETGHATASEAAVLAREAEVGLLALTHISTRSHPREIKAEALIEFPRVVVPRDFDQIEIPFPERGEPIVRSLRDRPRAAAAPEAGNGEETSGGPATFSADDL
jgi:ribonuclease Z